MRETNDPHVAQSGQIAPDSQSMPLSATTNTSNGCPSGASVSTPAVSPLFEGAFVHSLQFDLDADQKVGSFFLLVFLLESLGIHISYLLPEL